MSSTIHCSINNPDISGIGFRISFYLQNFLLVWLVDRSWQDAPGALWTFIATSFGLTIAAIVQTNRHQLSFFQALQISNLVWLANFGIFLGLAAYSRRKMATSMNNRVARKSHDFVKYGATAQTLLTMSLTIYLWADASAFGNESKTCFASLKYVLFVFNIRVESAGRIIALTVSCLLLGCYTILTIWELVLSHRSRRRQREASKKKVKGKAKQDGPPLASIMVHEHIESTPSSSSASTTIASKSTTMPGTNSSAGLLWAQINKDKTKRRPKHRWFDCDPMFLSLTLLQIVVFVYFVVSTELLLVRNPGPDNSSGQWGFGQILALVVVLPSVISILEAFDEVGMNRRPQTRKRNRRPVLKMDRNTTYRRQTLDSNA